MAGTLGIEGRKLRLWSRMKKIRLHSLLRAPAKNFFTNKRKQHFWRGPSTFFSFFDSSCCLRVFGSFMLQMIICSEILSCLRVAEVEREQPGARGNRWNLQEGREFAEIWPFWRIKHPHQIYGDLEGFSLILSNLNKVLGYKWKTLCRSLKFFGVLFFGGVGLSILWFNGCMKFGFWLDMTPFDWKALSSAFLRLNELSLIIFDECCWDCMVTPLKFNMSPENRWLEDVFPTEMVTF